MGRDRKLLEHTGYAVVSVRERPGFVQATVSRGHDRLLVEWVQQPLGYLAWAGCGKDPGFSPLGVIDHARRSSHYSTDEIASLAFDGPPPNPADLSRRWSRALETALSLIGKLPADHAGKAVLTSEGQLFRGQADELDRSLATGEVAFHAGRLGGALPHIKG